MRKNYHFDQKAWTIAFENAQKFSIFDQKAWTKAFQNAQKLSISIKKHGQ